MYGWVNNREAGDLESHRANYDDIVMCYVCHAQKIHSDQWNGILDSSKMKVPLNLDYNRNFH